MPEMRTCPYCGRNAILFHIPDNSIEETLKHPHWVWNNPGMWTIGCDTDGCMGNVNNCTRLFLTAEQAVAAWNTRADGTTQEGPDR